jgi:hypothetical protein
MITSLEQELINTESSIYKNRFFIINKLYLKNIEALKAFSINTSIFDRA